MQNKICKHLIEKKVICNKFNCNAWFWYFFVLHFILLLYIQLQPSKFDFLCSYLIDYELLFTLKLLFLTFANAVFVYQLKIWYFTFSTNILFCYFYVYKPRGVKKENLWYRPLWSVGEKRKKWKKKIFFVFLMINLNKLYFLVGHNYWKKIRLSKM